jgi:hypothetical protein
MGSADFNGRCQWMIALSISLVVEALPDMVLCE